MSEGIKVSEADPSFAIGEGEINLYYGLIRSGKTYGATVDVFEDLRNGFLVYATWPINVTDFDDRKSFRMLFWKNVTFDKTFFKVDCSKNFHYINAETGEVDGIKTFDPTKPENYIAYLNKLNHCKIYIDEAWRVMDSYKGTNFSTDSRNLILVTGHKFRTVNLIAQRPTSIHVTARGNVNRFYKFEKIFSLPRFGIIRFMRSEYQIMVGEMVDETQDPVSIKTYWGRRKYFEAYNSYYYGDLDPLHKLYYEKYEYDFFTRVGLFLAYFVGLFALRRRAREEVEKT